MTEPKRGPGRPATGKTPSRSMRLGDVYDKAKAKAEANGESITAVVERLLTEYVAPAAKESYVWPDPDARPRY